jgi:hypothetical protein
MENAIEAAPSSARSASGITDDGGARDGSSSLHEHSGSNLNTVEQVDDVLVEHPDAAV